MCEKEARFAVLLLSPLPVLSFDDREYVVVVDESRIEQCGYLRDDVRRVEVRTGRFELTENARRRWPEKSAKS
jgi:hypothetical protein